MYSYIVWFNYVQVRSSSFRPHPSCYKRYYPIEWLTYAPPTAPVLFYDTKGLRSGTPSLPTYS